MRVQAKCGLTAGGGGGWKAESSAVEENNDHNRCLSIIGKKRNHSERRCTYQITKSVEKGSGPGI